MKHYRIGLIEVFPGVSTQSIIFDDQDDVCDFMCQNGNDEKYVVFTVEYDVNKNKDIFYLVRGDIDFSEYLHRTKESNA